MQFLDHVGNDYLVLETVKQLSRVAAPFHTHTSSVSEVQFSLPSLAFNIIVIFYFSHSKRYAVIRHCAFNFQFPSGCSSWGRKELDMTERLN